MGLLPADHELRVALADEVHARPPEPLQAPSRLSHLAVLVDAAERDAERAHLEALCRGAGVPMPPREASQCTLTLGASGLRVKWERHGEFSSWTVIAEGAAGGFDPPASAALPQGWFAAIPGRTMMAAHALVLAAGATDGTQDPSRWFGANSQALGSALGGEAGFAYTDFRLQADGAVRFVLLDRSFTPRQAGRMMQRLFEIEVYRMLALLALPVAQALSPRLAQIEGRLATLTEGIARGPGHDETLLGELSQLAAEVERTLAASRFRFAACRAYAALVNTRIAELRESRLEGVQTIEEFMSRRFSPAVATCATVSQRLHELSDRVAHSSALLATRVGIARERQNQALLESMDRRARQQLHLQQTVEGLSVAAITYYAVGLVGYLAKAAKAAGWPLNADFATGLAVPLVAVAVWTAVRRARRALAGDEPTRQG